MKPETQSMRTKLWIYFILFSCIIMLSLWLLQTVFLNQFYEGMKADGMSDIAGEIIECFGRYNYEEEIDRLSFQNFIQVYITDLNGETVYYSDEHRSGGPGKNFPPNMLPVEERYQLPRHYNEMVSRLAGNEHITFTVGSDNAIGKSIGKTLIYGAYMDNYILYISMPLNPVDSTIDVLRQQLIYVTVISIALALVIAYFIARKLARPISRISESANELAAGNYDVSFPKGDYAEIDELADTLNYTAAELSKVEGLRQELVANISHDFRTPLTMIKAYAELIRDISGDDRQKREANLDIIIHESERLGRLVDDVLDLSQLQSGTEQLKMDNIDLSTLAENALKAFGPMFEAEGHSISGHIDPDQFVYADGTRMEQVLYNLISNAADHAADDRNVELSLRDRGGYVRCEISDNGPGIPEDKLPHIWERYYTAIEHSEGNTGLGLSIVKNILIQHNARYGVDSVEGQGSIFWFELNK